MDDFDEFIKLDSETFLRDIRQRMADFAGAQDRAASVVGRAVSSDGYVTVECTMDGVTSLKLDARIKRLGAEEIAEEILQTIKMADSEFKRETAEVMQEALGDNMPDVTDVAAAATRFEDAEKSFDQVMREAADELNRMRWEMGH
ncbi:YbaB/EbfC family nucleoid-associated protein [Nonomuraea sp. NPDC049400]|uniref:YbaB/EbfC family nucleoid-associated protein n=1 Tax=Nonomuraea sp. NPDC049400 TaxID=3364352 RepID=UPI0037882DE7